jgi:4-hydroxybenzoate polyprenyltransferase
MSFTNGVIIFVFLFLAVGLGMAWAIRSSRDKSERIKKMLPFLFFDMVFIVGFVLFVLQNQP